MKRFLFAALALLLCGQSLFAQTSRGAVSGLVADSTGAVIPNATVTLTNQLTGVSRTATSNGEGLYRFDAVDLGVYTVKLTATGFAPLSKNNVTVSANQTAQVDAQLTPGATEVSVDVTSEAGALLQTEAPVRGGNIDQRRIVELPVAGRNPVALALTLPGVSSNRGGFGVGTFSVNGGRGRSNNFLIDGTENNDISVAGQGFQITNPDAVAEVSVQTSNYDAEFGRAGGAVVNTITRSGTNQYHGSLSALLDSTRDDAITSRQSRDPEVVKRGRPLPGTQTIYSGTFGGPLIKDRTHFFGAYQEERQNSSSVAQLTTPTAAGRAHLRSLFPQGVSTNVDLLLDVTKNSVGVSNPVNVPLGIVNGRDRGNLEVGEFFRSYGVNATLRQWQARVDHKLGDNDQLSGRFLSDRQGIPKGGNATYDGFDADFTARLYNLLLAETHVFSPSLTNEARLAYNRIAYDFPIVEPNGLAGTLPFIGILPISTLGISANFPQGRIANNYTLQDTVTWIRGNHTFRGGVDLLRQISTQTAPFNARGVISFTSSAGFNNVGNFVDNFGGTSGSATRDFGSGKYFPSLWRTAAFAQDRWRVNEALTATLGVRYEKFGTPFNTLRAPAFTGLFNVDPVTLTGPFNQPNQIPADNNNFAPTIGLAWSPSGRAGLFKRLLGEKKTVARAGYQIGYDSFFNNIASNAVASTPNNVSTAFNSTIAAANPRGTPNFFSQIPTAVRAIEPRDSQTLAAPNLVNPYYQRWSLGVQRELPLNLLLDVSYVGSKGTRLYINEDANPLVRPELRVTPANFTGIRTGRFDNMQGPRTVRTNGGSSSYHAAQLKVDRRFANNFMFTGAYTWAKTLDNASEVFAQGGSNSSSLFAVPLLFGNGRNERAFSLFDRTHVASLTFVYELPFQREQRGWLGRVAGGWQISGVAIFESGVPFTVLNGFDADGISGANDRPNFNPNGQRGVRALPVTNAQGVITGYVNPDANNAPIDPTTARYVVNPVYVAGLSGSVPRVGTAGRNTERGPGTNNWNVNFQKRTRITEQVKLEYRAEFFNLFNHPQYVSTSVSPFALGAGTVGSNAATTVAGRFLVANAPAVDGGGRVVRFQMKLVF